MYWRGRYYQKHPVTGSESLRSHLVDTFVSYSLFGCKAGHLPNREDVCMHLPRFVKFFEDCQLVYGHVTYELLRTVFEETMKSNNDDGSWVGSPRNPQNAPARTRQLSRSSYSSKNLLGQVTNSVGPDFTREDLGSKEGSGGGADSSSSSTDRSNKPPSTLNRRDSSRSRSNSADPVFGEVQFLNWESFLWAFFKIARSQGLTVDSMIRNALTNHPHGSVPRTLTHPVSPVILPQEELDAEFRHVFEHYRVDGTHTDSLRFRMFFMLWIALHWPASITFCVCLLQSHSFSLPSSERLTIVLGWLFLCVPRGMLFFLPVGSFTRSGGAKVSAGMRTCGAHDGQGDDSAYIWRFRCW